MKDRITRGKYREAAAAAKPPREDLRSPGDQATPGWWSLLGHQTAGPLSWGLRMKVKEQFFGLE